MVVETDTLIGETLANRYLIEHRLGRGTMGTVYRARHVKFGRSFAVKVLHPELIEASGLQRFEREAELCGRLHHRNVIGVVDVGEAHGLHYMVMELAEGPDLATLIRGAPFAPARIIQLCRQLLEGLDHAHGVGLIHRDFKPENVIVEHDAHGEEVPRIVDFGIAILRAGSGSSDGPARLTQVGLVLGTPTFMSPEQTIGDPIDHRIDLFALGIVVYAMLAGKTPFDGTGVEVARSNMMMNPPTIADRVPFLEVDPLLEAFARRLMARNPNHRPPTAKAALDLLDLLETERAAAGSHSAVVTAFISAEKTERTRRRAPVIALAVGVVTVIAIVVVLVVGGAEERTTPLPATPPVIVMAPVDARFAIAQTPPDAGAPAAELVRPIHHDRGSRSPKKPTEHVAPPPTDARALAKQFQTVGAELRELEQTKGAVATSDLQPRFQVIRIVDAMSTQSKRDATTIVLAKLHDDIAARAID